MIRPEVPADLSGLTDDELAQLEADLKTWGRTAPAETSAEELEAAFADLTKVQGVITERAEAAEASAAEEERLAAARAAFGDPDEEGDNADDESDDVEDASGDAPGDEGGDLDEAGAGDPGTGTGTGSGAAGARGTATATRRPAGAALQKLNKSARRAPAPEPEEPKLGLVDGDGKAVDTIDQLGRLLHGARGKFGNVSEERSLVLASGQCDLSGVPSLQNGPDGDMGSAFANYNTLTETLAPKVKSLVASGFTNVCRVLSPNFDVYRVFGRQPTPLESSGIVPKVAAQRGGLAWFTPISRAWVADALSTIVCSSSATKAVAQVPCVSAVTSACVDAIVARYRVDNLYQRAMPEMFALQLEDLMDGYKALTEKAIINKIDANSTDVTFTAAGFGTEITTLEALILATEGLRARTTQPDTARLDLILTREALVGIAIGMLRSGSWGERTLSKAQIVARIENMLNVRCVVVDIPATGTADNLRQPQAAAAINPAANIVDAYLFPPGTHIQIDEGGLDVGMIRDSTLNGTNDVEFMFERWFTVAKVGGESLHLLLPNCPNGVDKVTLTAAVACTNVSATPIAA